MNRIFFALLYGFFFLIAFLQTFLRVKLDQTFFFLFLCFFSLFFFVITHNEIFFNFLNSRD